MSDMGMLGYQSARDMHDEEQEAQAARDAERERRNVESSLASVIRTNWEASKRAKQPIEDRMIDCLRRRRGEYSPDQDRAIREQGASNIYMMLTATKCRAAAAWIRDIMMPVNERCWGLDPTPVADVPPEFAQAELQRMMAEYQQKAQQAQQQEGGQPPPPPDEKQARERVRNNAQEAARDAADNMEDLIEDQLTEGGWDEALEGFIDDFVTFPAAFVRAPILRRVPSFQWGQNWQLIPSEEVRPEFERVSPFDMYPSPDAVNIDDGAWLIERTRFTRAQLHQLRGVPGYPEDGIDEVLRDYGQGGLRDWLWSSQEIHQLTDRGQGWLSPAETIDALIYHGSAMGLSLLQWGVPADQVKDPLAEYEIDAILVGRHVIRAVITNDPMGKRPYHKASFQLVPGSFWGIAIPELMDDVQDACNAAARAMINNMAIASGPQVEVNWDRLAPSEDGTKIYPWKIWRTKSTQTSGSDPAIRFYQPGSNIAELRALYDDFERRADDATNVPRYTYGNERVGGAGNTASGLSMLFESSNKGMKDSVKHIDRGVIRRVIESMWLFNMRYSKDQSIKGDCKAVARGSSAMLMREQVQQSRLQLFQLIAGNQLAVQIIGTEGIAKLLRALSSSVDIPDLIPDDETINERMAAQSQQSQQQAQMELQRLQAEIARINGDAQAKAASAQQTQSETQTGQQEAMADIEHKQAETRRTLAQVQEILHKLMVPEAVQ